MASTRHPLLSPKWIVGHLLALAVLVSFSQFGMWQLRRHDQRLARNEVLSARLETAPMPLDQALAEAAADTASGGSRADALRDRRVWVLGSFEPEDEVLRRPVSRDGHAGYHLVTPLALDDGRRLLVERGWVPLAMDTLPLAEAAPPAGEVRVVGRLKAVDRPPSGWVAALAPKDPQHGRLGTLVYLDPERLQDQVAGPLVQAVLLLEETEPPAAGDWPLLPQPTQISVGSHLGYAIQWFAFTLVTLIGYPLLLRRVMQEKRSPPQAPVAPQQ